MTQAELFDGVIAAFWCHIVFRNALEDAQSTFSENVVQLAHDAFMFDLALSLWRDIVHESLVGLAWILLNTPYSVGIREWLEGAGRELKDWHIFVSRLYSHSHTRLSRFLDDAIIV